MQMMLDRCRRCIEISPPLNTFFLSIFSGADKTKVNPSYSYPEMTSYTESHLKEKLIEQLEATHVVS